jgi:peptidoglycan/xylan/chitin deacetylase (PgdA/CDA1 family)
LGANFFRGTTKNMNNLTIVMYHYVRDLNNSRYPNLKGLDISLFKEQINYMRNHYHIISMEEVIYSIDNQVKIPEKSALLTFDDGYSDQYNYVFPILDKYKLQGSFFIPSKAITEHSVLDVNKVHFILASVEDKLTLVADLKDLLRKYKKEYKLEDFNFYYKKLAQPSKLDTKDVIFIKRLLQVELVEELRIIIIDNLFKKYIGISENAFSRELYMNEEQLKHMLRSGQHIGSHGHNHYWWNSLNREKMAQELDLSIIFLEKLGVDMNNWTACYPYGSYDNQSIEMLENRGCKLAVTTESKIASTNKKMRLVMPRLDTNDLPINSNVSFKRWHDLG